MPRISESSTIDGVYIVDPDVHGDDRGYFVETYRREWIPGGREMVQGNRGDRRAGAVVGLHYHLYQADYWYVPSGQCRVVLHDLRDGSATDGATQVIDLGLGPGGVHDHRAVYIPPGVAHGFAALSDMTITYLVDSYYNPADELGVAWNDPAVGADWGVTQPTLSARDEANPLPLRDTRSSAAANGRRSMTRLFVTGGAGFIGSNFVRHILRTSDDSVTVYDALTYAGTKATLDDVASDPRFGFVVGDICDREAVQHALDGHAVVVHFAAESHVDRSIVSPDEFVRTNCLGTNVLCDVARGVGVDRFVHISTDEVYGSIAEGSFHETDVLQPRSPYSASKAGSDMIAAAYRETYGLPVVITRSSNNFGPYQYPEKVIPLFVTNLLDGKAVPLYGDGLNVREPCYVEDNCAGIDVVRRRGEVGGTYNVGAGNEITNRDPTDRLLTLCGRDESSVRYVEDRLGHDRRYSIDTCGVRALGWSPSHDLDSALERTVAWYRDNRTWWEPLKARAAR